MQSESHRFEPFDPDHYEKEFLDVLLPSGEVVPNCWPNAGKLHELKGRHRVFLSSDHAEVRRALNPPQP